MTTKGHNSKVKAGPVAAGRLKSFVERIEKLREEKKAIGADERDVFAEAKGVGYDAPTIRWLLKEREMDAADRDERDALRDTYAHALGMAVSMVQVEGLSLRQAEAATGVSKSSIQRALAVPALSQSVEMTADDLGEITQTADLDTLPGDGEASADERDASASSSPPTRAEIAQVANKVAINAGEVSIEAGGSIFAESANNESCGGVEGHAGRLLAPNCQPGAGEQSQPGETLKDRKAAGTPAMAASGTAGVESGPQDLSAEAPQKVGAGDPPPEGSPSLYQRITGAFHDPLEFPPHLDRRASRGEG